MFKKNVCYVMFGLFIVKVLRPNYTEKGKMFVRYKVVAPTFADWQFKTKVREMYF